MHIGVSPYLCIEQTLMAGLKGATGLTKGRSLSEKSRWVLSRRAISATDEKVKEMQYQTSEEHTSMKHILPFSLKRINIDMDAMSKFCGWWFVIVFCTVDGGLLLYSVP